MAAVCLATLTGCYGQLAGHLGDDSVEVEDLGLAGALAEIERLALRARDGERELPLAEALDSRGPPRVVYVGESHDRYDNHLVQLAVLRALHRREQAVALGVEWFQQDVQAHLDDYIAGRIDASQMLLRTEYYERWRFDYPLYRPILEYAREHAIPVIALNAPQAITREIGRVGLDALPEELRAQLPAEYSPTNEGYSQRIRDAFELHQDESQPFEHFLDVMNTWDETMARNAAGYLEANPGHRLVVMAGRGHAGFRQGIPDRVKRRVAVSDLIVLPESSGSHHVYGTGDLLVPVPRLRVASGGKLGILVRTEEDRVLVGQVFEGSGAERAGIAAGDQITRLEGAVVTRFSHLKVGLLGRRPGQTVTVAIRSAGDGTPVEREVQVTLQ